jgi:putative phosphoesterase
MKIGVFSDTHGNIPRTKTVLEFFSSAGIDHVIHCGDLGSEDIVTLLFEVKESGIPVTAVAGNVDEWDPGLILYAKKLGMPLAGTARIGAGDFRAAVCHGHNPHNMDCLLNDSRVPVLFTGHTHVPRDEFLCNTRILNPGAVHRAEVPGYALFDTETGNWARLAL